LTAKSEFVFSHCSAASLWRLPRIGVWPTVVDVAVDTATGGRSTPGIRRHAEGRPGDPDTIDGIRVTSLARTVVDLARSVSWENAIVAADAALALRRFGGAAIQLAGSSLSRELERSSPRGTATARDVIDFASGDSGSPGESLSRVAIARHGLSRPILQQRFDDEFGRMNADFYWPRFGVIGEFDGVGKYLREQWTDGRTAAQVVVDEKWREDRLRLIGPRVVRWGWDVARQPASLVKLLRSVGVR
jgi:hypothetical protein